MGSLTKTERNRIHKVRERDRIRKQMQNEGLPVPPLMDPDVLGRGPGDGPSPRGADTGDEENKPSAAQVARETRQGFNARWEPVPSVELVPVEGSPGAFTIPEKKEGDVRPPSKAVLRDIFEHKVGSRDTNLRGPVDPEADAEAVETAEEGVREAGLQGDVGEEVKAARESAKTRSTDSPSPENPRPRKANGGNSTRSADASRESDSTAKNVASERRTPKDFPLTPEEVEADKNATTTAQTRSTDRPLPTNANAPAKVERRGPTAQVGSKVPPGVDTPKSDTVKRERA